MTDDMTMSPPDSETPAGDQVTARSKWPTVLGILGVIFGSIGILSSTCGFFLPAILSSVSEQMSPEEQAQIIGEMPTGPFFNVALIIGLLLAILWLWGSIRLLKRRQSARGLLNGYAVLAILWFICAFIWQATVVHPEMQAKQAELMQAAQQKEQDSATNDVDQMDSMGNPLADTEFYFSQACGGVWVIGWSVLILFFMNSGRYRHEIESWRD